MGKLVTVSAEYLSLLEAIEREAREVEHVLVSFVTGDAHSLNLTDLMEALTRLDEWTEEGNSPERDTYS
jgi:hypothetical protein